MHVSETADCEQAWRISINESGKLLLHSVGVHLDVVLLLFGLLNTNVPRRPPDVAGGRLPKAHATVISGRREYRSSRRKSAFGKYYLGKAAYPVMFHSTLPIGDLQGKRSAEGGDSNGE